jgi:hypothetical protein
MYTDCVSPRGDKTSPKFGPKRNILDSPRTSPKLGRSASGAKRTFSWKRRGGDKDSSDLTGLDVTQLPLPKDPYSTTDDYEVPDTTAFRFSNARSHGNLATGGTGGGGGGRRSDGSSSQPPKLPTSPPPARPGLTAATPTRTTNLCRHNSRSVDNVSRKGLLRAAKAASSQETKRHSR